jgi:aminoglycoside phosphotransferase (APT) family kinase protein
MPSGQPWEAEHAVEAAQASALVADQFPALVPVDIRPLGKGWDNTAFLVNGTWVFRFPRRRVAVPLLEREVRLLPAVAPTVPLAIPVPELVGKPGGAYPWPFAGYRYLRGQTASAAPLPDSARSAMAEPLGEFLRQLHAFPTDRAAALGAPGDELGRTDVPMRIVKARASLAELERAGVLPAEEQRRLDKLIDSQPAAEPAPPVLVHGDLYVLHLLVEGTRLSAVIDWGDIHLGHPGVDLAVGFSFLPTSARAAFRAAYGAVDEATWRLAGFRALYHSAYVAQYAHATGQGDLLREGLSALHRLASDGMSA